VRAVAVRVPGRHKLDGAVGRDGLGAEVRAVALREKPRADQLPVAGRGREPRPGVAAAAPASGDGRQVPVRQAASLGPDAGVEHPNDDVGAVVRDGPEAETRSEAHELRGPGGVQRAGTVLERGEHGRVAPQLLGAGRRHGRGEAVEDGAVDVERLQRGGPAGRRRGEGGGGVPVRVGGEHGRLGAMVHAEDVRLPRLLAGAVCSQYRRRR